MSTSPKVDARREVYTPAYEGIVVPWDRARRRTDSQAPVARGNRGLSLDLEVFTSLADARALWAGFETTAEATFYQSYLWCEAWLDTLGASGRVEPRIVVARHADGSVAFILPLQLRWRFGATVLEWLTAPYHTHGYGLYDPAFLPLAGDWFAAHWPEVASRVGPHDATILTHMPSSRGPAPHPLSSLFNLTDINRSYRMALGTSYDGLAKSKLSGSSRRHDRKEQAALAAHGALSFSLPEPGSATRQTIDLMFRQQRQRLREQGVRGLFGPDGQAFVQRLLELDARSAEPVLLPYRLDCGGETLAVMLGAAHGGTYWGLISSLTGSPLRRHSPGDLAIRKTIEVACAIGLAQFDFATGDTAYKTRWADEVTSLQAFAAAGSLRGLLVVSAVALAIWVKRQVKQRAWSRDLAVKLRRRLFGRP